MTPFCSCFIDLKPDIIHGLKCPIRSLELANLQVTITLWIHEIRSSVRHPKPTNTSLIQGLQLSLINKTIAICVLPGH